METIVDFRLLNESSKDGIIIVNSSYEVEFANNSIRNMFGYELAEIIGKPVEILMPDRFIGSYIKKRNGYALESCQGKEQKEFEISGKRRDGTEFPIDILLTTLKTETGFVIAATIRDITERKKIEAQQKFLADSGQILMQTLDYENV